MQNTRNLLGKQLLICTPEKIQTIKAYLEQSLQWSQQCHAVSLNISNRWLRQILHKYLNFQWYKIQQVQELHECDLISYKNFCHKFLACVDEDEVQSLLRSDEDNFHHARFINKQIYTTANNNPTNWTKTITQCDVYSVVGIVFLGDWHIPLGW